MSKHYYFVGPASILVIILALLQAATCIDAIVNSKIDRIIDLSSQLVKITDRIHIDEKVGLYKIILEQSHKNSLAYIGASISGQPLKLDEKSDGSYEIDLTGQNAKPLVVTSVFTQLLKPYPAEIRQSERQLVLYDGLQTPLTPYLTKTVTTKIKLPQGSRLESFTKASKMTTGTTKLTYGPFKDVQPNQADSLTIHFENNTPFVAVTSLVRNVELSPWAKTISVVNQVKVEHVGAKLKGPFSRIDYQRDHSNGISSVRNFAVDLPRQSRDIYYRDGIGNISTSQLKHTTTHIVVALKPRFPLFGGWMTDFVLGYNLPMSDFLNEPTSGNNYRLSIPFNDNLYDNMFIEDATVRLTLPAGASDVEVKGSILFERLKDEHDYSYLDLIGRKTIVLKKRNIVEQHLIGNPLIIRFNYKKIYMAQEPLLLIAAAIGTLLLVALYSKLSSKSSSSNSSQSKKVKSD